MKTKSDLVPLQPTKVEASQSHDSVYWRVPSVARGDERGRGVGHLQPAYWLKTLWRIFYVLHLCLLLAKRRR
jgi:hypothetical protein